MNRNRAKTHPRTQFPARFPVGSCPHILFIQHPHAQMCRIFVCKVGMWCIFAGMKILLFILLAPIFGYAQAYVLPKPIITLLRVETNKDTLFVYRQVRQPPHSMSFSGEWIEYNDREVYVIRNAKIIFLKAERPKVRKIMVEKEEEYW